MPDADHRWPPFDPAVVRAVAAALGPSRSDPTPTPVDVDLESFAYVASYWHVAPRLWLELRARSDLPLTVREQLRTEYWRNTRSNAILRDAAREVFAALNARGIVPMIIKGGCQLFDPPSGHAGTRFMVDLDVLAPPGQDQVSFDVLRDMGFAPDSDNARHHWPRLSKKLSGLEGGLAVEVHKTPWIEAGTDVTRAFFASSHVLDDPTMTVRLPSTAHRLLNNVAHAFPPDGQFSYYAIIEPDDFDEVIGCTDLKQLFDFAEMCCLRSDRIDWRAVMDEAEHFGRGSDLQQWAYLAEELFSIRLPDGVANWRVKRRVPRTIGSRCRRVVKTALRTTHLLGPARRLKEHWHR